jgi:hypothetical protein
MQIEFDAAAHEYKIGGVKIPSVTQIIKEAGLMPTYKPDGDFAMVRGSHVHKAAELYDLGRLDEENLDQALVPYLEGWKKYREQAKIEFVAGGIEKMVADQAGRFAGTLDRLGLDKDGALCVIDIKTGSPAAWHSLQMAAYAMTQKGLPRRIAVYLTGAAEYRVTQYPRETLIADQITFQGALAVCLWKRSNIPQTEPARTVAQ